MFDIVFLFLHCCMAVFLLGNLAAIMLLPHWSCVIGAVVCSSPSKHNPPVQYPETTLGVKGSSVLMIGFHVRHSYGHGIEVFGKTKNADVAP